MEPTLTPAHPGATGRGALTPILLASVLAGTVVFLWSSGSAAEVYLTLHVIAAVVWVGGGAALTILAILTERTRDAHALVNLIRQVEWIATRVFTPSSLVTLGFGIALVQKWGIGYDSFWIGFSLVVWGLSFVLGIGVIGPELARVNRLIDERGVADALVQQGIRRALRVARIDVAMLLLVVVDMAAKPAF